MIEHVTAFQQLSGPGTASARTTERIPKKSELTPRETEVLCLMADGLTTKAIASKLSIAVKTASCHRQQIHYKLGPTALAVRWAIREGLVKP